MKYIPFTQAQPDDQQLIVVAGLTDPNDPEQREILTGRWHSTYGLLVLPDLTMQAPRGGCSWRPTRQIVVAPAAIDFDVPSYADYVAQGNCEVCASQRLQEFYASEQFAELFPTDEDGTEEERREWENHLFGDDEEPDDDGHVPCCPNCSQPW